MHTQSIRNPHAINMLKMAHPQNGKPMLMDDNENGNNKHALNMMIEHSGDNGERT